VNLVENNPIRDKLGLCRHKLPVCTAHKLRLRRHKLSVRRQKLGIVEHDKLLLLGHNNLSFARVPTGRGRPLNKSIVAVLGVHHHVSFQLPVLFELFPARLAHFGQLFGLLHGANIGGQMNCHVHLEIVFALKLCRALVANKVLIVCVHKHVTSHLGLNIKTLCTVGTGKFTRYALMRHLMAFKIVQIIGRIIALLAMELAHVLVTVNDVLVQDLAVGAQELWTVRAAVDLLV